MAIIIQNISQYKNLEYGKGKQIYQIYLNRIKICKFEHTFEDGLAVCLKKASKAVELWAKERE